MDIESTKTNALVPLLGTFNHEEARVAGVSTISFHIDWTKGGDGQDVLRDHIRLESHGRVVWHGKQYKGVPKVIWGINTEDSLVVLEVA